MSSLGEVIQKVRKEKKLTTTELANMIDLTQGYISHIENNRKNPSLDILRKLAGTLNIDFYELAYLAGYFTEHEKEKAKHFHLTTPEELQKFEEDDFLWQMKQVNIMEYQEKKYVRIEDFLGDTKRSFYIDDHKLSEDDIKMLIALYGGKEKDYPSDEQIEKEYEEIKRKKEEYKKRIASGEAFFIVDGDYDINTNEDI